MYLKVLVDNNTIIDDYAYGEPGLSFYIEEGNKKILFDTGYSDILIKNAKHYNINLNDLDYIVFSHSHNDHTRGLKYLLEEFDLSSTCLIAHPDVFYNRKDEDESFGCPISLDFISEKIKVKLIKDVYNLTDNLYFLGEIERSNNFENKDSIGQYLKDEEWLDDYCLDDSALVYKSQELHVITGCSHSGICNIVENAEKKCDGKVSSIIGGMHLFECDDILENTIAFFEQNKIKQIYPCHCVSFQAKARMHKKIPVVEVGVGFELKI